MHHAEPQARAAALHLGREERLEDPARDILRHAKAAVAYRQGRIRTPLDAPFNRVRCANLHASGFDDDRAAIGHRIAGIDDEVQEGVLYAAPVEEDEAKAAAQPRFDRNAVRAAMEQQRHGVLNQPVQIARRRIERLLARKSQETLHDTLAAACGPAGIVHEPADRRVRRQVPQRQFDVHRDRGQDVAEVMGDAARQVPDRLQLLRLLELVAQGFFFRQIADGGDDEIFGPGRAARASEPELRRKGTPVIASGHDFVPSAVGGCCIGPAQPAGGIADLAGFEQACRFPSDRGVGGAAEHLLGCRIE